MAGEKKKTPSVRQRLTLQLPPRRDDAAARRKHTGDTRELWGSFPAPVLGLLIRLREQLMGCEGMERSAPEPTVCIMHLITEIPNYIPGLSLSPANYQVNIPIRPGRRIRRIRQLLSLRR